MGFYDVNGNKITKDTLSPTDLLHCVILEELGKFLSERLTNLDEKLTAYFNFSSTRMAHGGVRTTPELSIAYKRFRAQSSEITSVQIYEGNFAVHHVKIPMADPEAFEKVAMALKAY